MRLALAAAVALAMLIAGCGGQGTKTVVQTVNAPPSGPAATTGPTSAPLPVGRFDPVGIYRREAPGVVTVISVFRGRRSARGLGSGFVVDGNGEVATNAHVVTEGEGRSSQRANEVYVQFADGNQVGARIVGTDPDYDVALLKVSPDPGVKLHPLPLGHSSRLVVGEPVAAIGSPFGERQSLSVGVVSAVDRTIQSLTRFQIPDAIQTDAAINRGNSGGPLVDAGGRVVGIISQFSSSSGANDGVGYAVPVDTVRRSLAQLRSRGRAEYPYVGVSTVALYPQLARRLKLPVTAGALVQEVVRGGPADQAGIRAGNQRIRFQGEGFRAGGDVIVTVAGHPIREEADVARALAERRPGERVKMDLVRGDRRLTVEVRLGKRP
jgi:S1-C subfamily serine protease